MALAPDTNHICYYVHSKSFKSWIPWKSFSSNLCQPALREFPRPQISSLWRVSKYPVLQRCSITKPSYKSSLPWSKSARYLCSGPGLCEALSSQAWLHLNIRLLAPRSWDLGCSVFLFYGLWLALLCVHFAVLTQCFGLVLTVFLSLCVT